MRRHGGNGEFERLDIAQLHRNRALLILQDPFDDKVRRTDQSFAMAVELFRLDNRIRDSRLVFDAQEQESVGSSGPLAADDTSGDAYDAPVRDPLQVCRG